MQAIGTFRRELKRDQEPSGISEDDLSCEEGEVNVDKLLDDVKRVVASFPKKVPFFIEKNENVPQAILSDELKLFRSMLNYVTNACKHTSSGSITLKIYTRGKDEGINDLLLPGAVVHPKRDVLIVEVHDTGKSALVCFMCECIEVSMRWDFFSLFFEVPEGILHSSYLYVALT